MRIHTYLSYQWDDVACAYKLIHEDGYDIPAGSPIALCKGASDAQNNLAASQTAFYDTLQKDYAQQFAGQNAILSSLNTSLQPIISAGPNQYGFSQGETNTLNSQAIQGTAQQFNAAKKQLQNQQAAAGGGNQYLPSGVNAQQNEQLAAAGANQTSSELLGIQQAGYQQGASQYQSAIGQEEAAAGLYNPTSYADSANTAGSSAGSELNTIQQENAAASPWATIGGILGGAGSALAGGLTGGLGTAVSKIGSGNFGW